MEESAVWTLIQSISRATIRKHLKSFKNKFPDLIALIENQLYLDDLLGGADTVEAAEKAVSDTNHIFSAAQLKMTKWTTSSPDLRRILMQEDTSNKEFEKICKMFKVTKWKTDELITLLNAVYYLFIQDIHDA